MARYLLAVALAVAGCAPQAGSPSDGGAACRDERDCSAGAPVCDPGSGSCVACRWSTHCSGAELCEDQACRAARSCQELATELPGLPSGTYTLDVDGDDPLAPVDAWCEMSVDGGGWTLVQRTRWRWAESQPLLTDFATWHGETIGTPGATGAYRLAGAYWPALAAGGELMVVHRVRTTSGGACEPLYYVATGAALAIDPASASAQLAGLEQPATLVNTPDLSTTNSGPAAETCVGAGRGVPWFYGSCCTTCPTYQGSYWTDEPHPMQSYTDDTPDLFGHTEATACAGQTVRISDSMSSYRGVDSMEVYLR